MTTKYTTKGGETLLDIATRFTLSPAYYEALGTYNGLDSFQITPDYHFPAGEIIGIPDNWLRPGTALRPAPGNAPGVLTIDVTGASGASGATSPGIGGISWGVVAIAAGALLGLATLSPRRTRRARRA